MKQDYGEIRTMYIDLGAQIAVVVERNGERRVAGRIPNLFWEEVDAEWHEAHPNHGKAA